MNYKELEKNFLESVKIAYESNEPLLLLEAGTTIKQINYIVEDAEERAEIFENFWKLVNNYQCSSITEE